MITKEIIELEIEAEEDLIYYIQQMDAQQIVEALMSYVSIDTEKQDEDSKQLESSELKIVLEKLDSLEAKLKRTPQSYSPPPNRVIEGIDDPFCDMFSDIDDRPVQVEETSQEETDWSLEEMHIC